MPPAAPTGLAVSDGTSESLTVTWTDNSAKETSYELQRSLGTETFNAVVTYILAADQESFTDTGLTPETTYQYRLRACRAEGCSTYTPIVGVKTAPSP